MITKYEPPGLHAHPFFVNGPILLWDSLPNNIRETESLSTFKEQTKTFLFKRSFLLLLNYFSCKYLS